MTGSYTIDLYPHIMRIARCAIFAVQLVSGHVRVYKDKKIHFFTVIHQLHTLGCDKPRFCVRQTSHEVTLLSKSFDYS
jgi:hypothetical protein